MTLKLIGFTTAFYAERSVSFAVDATEGMSTAKFVRLGPKNLVNGAQIEITAQLEMAVLFGLVPKNNADSFDFPIPWEITVPKLPTILQMIFLPAKVPCKN